MSTLHVRNVPDELYGRIRQQAQAKNRSISAEVITLLARALEETDQSQAEILDRINRRRFFKPQAFGAPDSLSLLSQDRAR